MPKKNNVLRSVTDKNGHIKISREIYKALYKEKKSRLKPLFFWFLFSIFLIIFTCNSLKLFSWNKDNIRIEKLGIELFDIAKPTSLEEEGDLVNPPQDKESDYWYYVKFPFYNVDFSNLLKKNSDTIAFINVPNTNINYPVVKSSDNKYYLTHAFDKSKNYAGWVFMDYRNESNFTDSNTIIYGHGRLDKTVFGSLKNVLTSSWQNNKDNYVINISTPKTNYVFQIFSLYTIKEETYYLMNNFGTTKKKDKWLQTMQSRSIVKTSTSVDSDDKILTLSTCENNSGGRIVVHAKLIKKQKKET